MGIMAYSLGTAGFIPSNVLLELDAFLVDSHNYCYYCDCCFLVTRAICSYERHGNR